jgi:hypothetical protein
MAPKRQINGAYLLANHLLGSDDVADSVRWKHSAAGCGAHATHEGIGLGRSWNSKLQSGQASG